MSQICRISYYNISYFRRINRYLPLSIAKYIATALVTSRLDYCKWIFHNITIKDITKQQRVQNCLARAATRYPHFTHSKPLLKSLHWLSIWYRIIIKVCTVTCQALSCKQLSYILSLLTHVRKPVQLRPSSSNLLFVPKVNASIGTKPYAVGERTLWNMFLLVLNQLKILLNSFATLPIYHRSLTY